MGEIANKKIYFGLLALFILIISIGIFLATNFESSSNNHILNQALNQVGGFNVLSMSLIDMSSPSPWLRGEKVWALSVTGGGLLGQSASVRISPSTAPVSGKDRPASEFSIEIKDIKQQCQYSIRVSSDYSVEKLDTRTWSQWGNSCSIDEAIKQTGQCAGEWVITDTNNNPIGLRTGTAGVYSWCGAVCAVSKAAYVGDIANPNIQTVIKTGLYGGKDGQSYEGTIDNFNNVFERIGPESNPIGAVVWQGGFFSGLSCENQDLYKAIYVTENTETPKWRIIEKSYYDNYKSKYSQLLDTCYCDFGAVNCPSNCERWDGLANRAATVNRYADTLMASQATFGTFYQQTNLNNAKIILDSTGLGLFNNPVLTYYIKASWIGIYTPSPKAQIMSSNSECFKTGDKNANINFVVKNIGDEYGNFQVSAQCSSPFSAGMGYTISLNPQESTTVYIPVTVSPVNQVTKQNCQIYVKGVFGQVTASQQVCSDPRVACQKSTKFCSGNQLWECNEYGTAQNMVKDCSPNKCISTELGAGCEDKSVCNNNDICETARKETSENCGDCRYCYSCAGWFFSLFQKSSDRCTPKKVFETKCSWYDLGCNFHNLIVPSWTQSVFCPFAIGLIILIILLFIIVIIIIIRKNKQPNFRPKKYK